MPSHRRISHPFAFTLIELLVVISIISLLISILLPALSSARQAARSVECLTRMKSFGTYTYMYQQDYKDWFPADRAWGGFLGTPVVLDDNFFTWVNQMQPYLGNLATNTNMHYTTGVPEENYLLCPGQEKITSPSPAEVRTVAYISDGAKAVNYHAIAFFGFGTQSATGGGTYDMKREQDVLNTQQQAMVAEVFSVTGHRTGYLGSTNSIISPHPGGSSNMLFVDRHARNVGDDVAGSVAAGEILLTQ